MSNGRAGIASRAYRLQYLKSKQWHARRARWFDQNPAQHQCCVCKRMEPQAKRRLELHHIDYRGVTQLLNGGWLANERDEDLLPMHPLCHRLVHELMDNDGALRYMRSRKEATLLAIAKVRSRLRNLIGAR
ncbi:MULTISPECIES: hypothetical protein [unclassified Pseudoclavibacter]|uniref:hypothetical protein n=1 Tax=unclassified Pseudoclavibacter TaxID=2615177 RepID=UPI001BA5467E|nr:hypothetical protein [Pseudoclavibacter sp. Marseille-Q4354]MBS3177211.1 hypothetical protein [Pseudoclavibacter sp. Marseille-Q4354]